uniref:Uncharacterized protein n=1 Tax=Rhizophora mucronata TaxID=61149 RepID=A0A2P2PZI3_RHIMU
MTSLTAFNAFSRSKNRSSTTPHSHQQYYIK